MFNQDCLNQAKKAEGEWGRMCGELYPDKKKELVSATFSGIPIKAVYTPLDVKDMSYLDLGMPGEYPYTRGTSCVPYRIKPWEHTFVKGFGSAANLYERQKLIDDLGQVGANRGGEIDLPTKMAYGAEHPISRGWVGIGGISINTVDDFDELLNGENPAEIDLTFPAGPGASPLLAMYIVCAERRGVPADRLMGYFGNYAYESFYTKMACFPPKSTLEYIVEHIKYCTKYMPKWRSLCLGTYNITEGGANAFQAIAFMMGVHIVIVEESIKAGLAPDDFIPSFFWYNDVEDDFFEAIAKLRCLRRMWAKINKEKFGCRKPDSLKMDLYLQTGGLPLTRQQPLNNIARIAIQALAAALGGVDYMHTNSYDEALSLPTEEAVTIAMRTQQIVAHELNIDKVCDPLGGSYYVEYLTNKLEEEANKVLNEIGTTEEFIKRWENGWFRRELAKGSLEREEQIRQKKKLIVGLNEYVTEENQKVPVFTYDPKAEERITDKLKRFKGDRNSTKVEAALKNIRQAPKGEVIPTLIDAARVDVTLGEMGDALRDKYDWMRYY